MSVGICPDPDGGSTGNFLASAVINAFLVFALLFLFIHTIFHEHHNRKVAKYRKTRDLQYMYITMQILALLWAIMYTLINTIDTLTHILRNSFLCGTCAYLIYYIPANFYMFYLYQLVIRLEISFRGSVLELSRCTLRILKIIVVTLGIVPTIILLIDRKDLYCLRLWFPSDPNINWTNHMDSDHLTFCTVAPYSLLIFQLHIYEANVLLVNMLNLSIGMIFTVKLKKFIKLGKGSDHQRKKQFKFEAIIIKNNILTLTGSFSSLFAYVVFYFTGITDILTLDTLVNCLVIGLMFKWNEKYYKKLCKCCIMLCFKRFDPETEKTEDYLQQSQMSSVMSVSPVSPTIMLTPTLSNVKSISATCEDGDRTD